jgi:hypothetical protein
LFKSEIKEFPSFSFLVMQYVLVGKYRLSILYLNCFQVELFWWYWGLNSRLHATKQALNCLIHTSSPFCFGYFGDGVLQAICRGWSRTSILLIQSPKYLGLQVWATGAWLDIGVLDFGIFA